MIRFCNHAPRRLNKIEGTEPRTRRSERARNETMASRRVRVAEYMHPGALESFDPELVSRWSQFVVWGSRFFGRREYLVVGRSSFTRVSTFGRQCDTARPPRS